MPTEKILWVVNYDTLAPFLSKASAIGATGVAIRTDNDVQKAIPVVHAKEMKIYGWRWPSSSRDPAMREADKVVGLLASGLDGYFVDPEGAHGEPYDWDQNGLAKLADTFCKRVTDASEGKPFGVTSHYRAAAVYPRLPWATFFDYASVLLPQAYWRSTKGTIGHGIPADNYQVAIDFWVKAGGDRGKIVPMAGELGVSTPEEIAAYAAEAVKQNITTLHFYSYGNGVPGKVWDAVKAAGLTQAQPEV